MSYRISTELEATGDAPGTSACLRTDLGVVRNAVRTRSLAAFATMTLDSTRSPASQPLREAGDEAVPPAGDAGGAASEPFEALAQATSAVSRASGVQAILEAAVAAALQLIRARASAAWALDPHGERALSAILRADPRAEGRGLGADIGDSPFRSRVLETRMPLRLRSAELAEDALGSAGERPGGGYLAVPFLARDGGPLGVLELLGRIEGEFTAAEQSMLAVLAQAAASALEGERLREVFKREQDRMCLAVKVAEVGTWCVDLKSKLDTRDGTVNGILGLAPVESTQPMDDFISYVHPDDRRRLREEVAFSIETGAPHASDFRILRTDGAVRWVRGKGRTFTGPDGRAQHFAGVVCDITETRYLKDRRDQALVQLQASLSASFVGTYIRDCRTDDINADEGLLRLFGFPLDATMSLGDYASRIHPDDRDRWSAMVGRFAETGTSTESEYRVVWPDGSVHWVFDKGTMIFDAEGNHLYTAGACADVTYRRQIEEERRQLLLRERAARREAEEASRAKDDFLITISHELRTPLTAVLGWAQILRAGYGDAERVRKGIEIIERNARAQATLIEDLLDVSRIVTGKMRMARDPVSIATVAETALETIRQGAEAKQIALCFEADPSVGEVVGDPDRLQQVVRNLLSNAVKFTPPGGRVSLRIERADPCVEVVVSDTGQGIPASFLPFVFDRFRQAESGMTRAHGGLGLGLSIVREIVALHGGTVDVASEGEGRGARFTLRLPVSSAGTVSPYGGSDAVAAVGAAGLPRLAGITALVVEDEADSRDLISLILEQNGARVMTTASAKDALAALARVEPDVIVSDIGMPAEDGYAFLSGLRTLAPPLGSIPAVALTAYTRNEDCRRALDVGFQAHLSKPIDPERLVTEVGRFARRHAFKTSRGASA